MRVISAKGFQNISEQTPFIAAAHLPVHQKIVQVFSNKR